MYRMGLSTKSLLRHGSLLSLLTFGSRLLGLAREITKAALLGTGALSDAFSVAFLIPNLFRRLFAEGSISVAFIPVFKSSLMDGDGAQTKKFLSSFFTVLSFFVSLTVGLGMLLSPYIVPVFGPETFEETVFLTRLMFPFLAFISIAAFFQGILNTVNVFAPAGCAPILLNIAAIACAWLLKDAAGNAARAMGIGILIGGFLGAAVQMPFVIKHGFTFRITGLFRAAHNKHTKAVLALIVPTIVGMAAYQLNDLVSSALARNAGVGVLSSLQYSLRLQELILGVFAVSIGTVLLPDLAESARKKDWERYTDRLSQAAHIILLITIPVTFFSLVCGEEMIRLLFQMRSFDETSVKLTLYAFKFHIAGLFCIALNRVLTPAFYARKDTASPTIAGIFSFAVNTVLAAILVRPMQGGGIALALSIAGAVNTAVLFVLLKRTERRAAGSAHASGGRDGGGTASGGLVTAILLYSVKIAAVAAAASGAVLAAKPFLTAVCRALLPGKAAAAALAAVAALVFVSLTFTLLLIIRDPYAKTLLRTLRNRRA
jgi:putative peptidoglycan lipid II flippase